MGWRTGDREGDVPTQPQDSGDGASMFYVIILVLCAIVMCVICVATACGVG